MDKVKMHKEIQVLFLIILMVIGLVEAKGVCAAEKTLDGPVITVKGKDETAVISWNAIEGATGYRVYRKTPYDKKWEKVTTTRKTKAKDSTWVARPGDKIKYLVRAYYKDESGKVTWGEKSDKVSWKTPTAFSTDKIESIAVMYVFRKYPETERVRFMSNEDDNTVAFQFYDDMGAIHLPICGFMWTRRLLRQKMVLPLSH